MAAADLGEVDMVVAELVLAEDGVEPFQHGDAIAVRAILALSRAGADQMTAASHAGRRDVERLSKAARILLDEARALMVTLVNLRIARREGH